MTYLEAIKDLASTKEKEHLVNTVGLIILGQYAKHIKKRIKRQEEKEDVGKENVAPEDVAWDAMHEASTSISVLIEALYPIDE